MMVIKFRNHFTDTSVTSLFPILIMPLYRLVKRNNITNSEDFPDPVRPQIPTHAFLGTFKEKFLTAGSKSSRYFNSQSINSIPLSTIRRHNSYLSQLLSNCFAVLNVKYLCFFLYLELVVVVLVETTS